MIRACGAILVKDLLHGGGLGSPSRLLDDDCLRKLRWLNHIHSVEVVTPPYRIIIRCMYVLDGRSFWGSLWMIYDC